jgi:DNA mismatch repair protein MutS2
MNASALGPHTKSSMQELRAPDLDFLDWPELLGRLAGEAQSSRGQAACAALPLADSPADAESRMADIAEAVALLRAGEALPGLNFPEIEAHLDAVEKGVPLGAEELRQVAGLCEVSLSVRRRLERLDPATAATGPQAPRLAQMAADLSADETIVFHARETFDATGELRDSASPELFRLRREREQVSTRVRDQAERVMRSEEYAPYLQDEYVTLREDRFVLPLKASFKSMGLGIVHDTSRSGETVFVEPTGIVELNNRLKVTEIEIRRESRRILEELAALVAAAAPGLRQDREVLTRLDVIFAGARLALAYDGVAVQIVTQPVVDLPELRHPLLALRPQARGAAANAPASVVANDVALGDVEGKSSARILVISGPNAGGKTVLLKAVGLAALAARAGLLIPAAPGSRIGFFDRVLADIGDQQSVLGDLSTFSAHLANLARILELLDRDEPGNQLVLCDELMAGTHPEQGAALARATLETLADRRALVITTTHYDSLKALTEGDARFRNAGMEYDVERLRPTFRLRDGLPGRSYALDIAARMGMPPAILDRARELVGAASLGLEEILRNLEEREATLGRAEQALDDTRRELEKRTAEEQAATAALSRRERELGQKSREVIDRSVAAAKAAIAEVVREVRQQRTVASAVSARDKLDRTAREAALGLPEREAVGLDVDKLREALAARSLGVTGKQSNRAELRTARAKARTTAVAEAAPEARDEVPELAARANSVDVRGKRADEALAEVESFLDRSALGGVDHVLVIHGHGTGALRKAVREYLATSPYVERFRPGGAGEGGDGVSVVSLRA